jgi:hypothetical protein
VGVERSSIKPKGFKGAFFYYQSNVHTFNCRYRTDRRVEGLVAEGWGGGRGGGGGGRWDGWFAKVDNRFGLILSVQGGSIGLALL